jgi:hypothetical protein
MSRWTWNNYEPPPRLDDSARNQLAGLQHEACEHHCEDCGRCDVDPTGPATTKYVPMTKIGEHWYCEDCAQPLIDLIIPEAWKPEPAAYGYDPGPELSMTSGDVTLTVQRTHLHLDTAAYYWRILIEGHQLPAVDGSIIALDPTMTTARVAAELCWHLYATKAARTLAGDSHIIIHHTPDTDPINITRCSTELHDIHQEITT